MDIATVCMVCVGTCVGVNLGGTRLVGFQSEVSRVHAKRLCVCCCEQLSMYVCMYVYILSAWHIL